LAGVSDREDLCQFPQDRPCLAHSVRLGVRYSLAVGQHYVNGRDKVKSGISATPA